MTPTRRLSQTEFIALIAMLYASVAFSVDAMLPAMPEIAAELTPAAPNRAQLVVTSFMFGLGVGTLFTGPMSDAFGRKRVIVGGVAVYILGAVLAWMAQSLELLLAARALQGLGAAAPRVVSMAIVRDLYSGRQMARIVSFAMMVFMLFPAMAPLLGSFVIAGFGWRGVFGAFVVFSVTALAWLILRQPETHPPEARRPLKPGKLWEAATEALSHRIVVIATLVQTLTYASIMAVLSSVQQIFDQTFGRADSFPAWFALMALLGACGSFINARIVLRVGMRRVIKSTLVAQFFAGLLFAGITVSGLWPDWAYFPAYVVFNTFLLLTGGLIFGNVNALAMEPVGHIAGMAASIIGTCATIGAVMIAIPIGLAFDGTPVPLAAGAAINCAIAWLLMRNAARETPPPKQV